MTAAIALHGRNQPRTYTEEDYKDFSHTGPGTLAGRYLRLFWQAVHVAADLPVGRAVPIRVMSEDFTLYRGQSGTAHVVDARCAHRGALLHTGWVEGDCIRCIYHGWQYDQTGQCVEMPAEVASYPAKVKIGGYPTEEYLGFIFAYFGEGDPPPLPRYPFMEGDGFLDVGKYLRLCNYFQNVENNVDPAHTPFTHRSSSYTRQGLVSVPQVSGHESEWGIEQHGKRPEGTRISHHGMPTLLNLKFQPTDEESGWKDLMVWRVPIDDTRHWNYIVNYVQVTGGAAERYKHRVAERRRKIAALPRDYEVAEAILRGELRIEDILDRPDYLEIQDHVSQVSQGIIADRDTERLGRSDVLVVLLRRLWYREMKALAEGRPLKQWRRPPEMVATTGLEKRP